MIEDIHTIAESLAEGLLITDADDVVLYMNSRMAELTGYPMEELLGQPAHRFLLTEDQWSAVNRRNAERFDGISERYELEILRKDGTTFWSEISAAPYRDVNGKIVGTIGAHTDVTERKSLEEQLLQGQKMQSIGELTTGIAHNFNNILMGSSGNIELAMMDAPEELQEYLREALDANREAADLIKELMVFSRRTDVERPPTDLGVVIREVTEFCRVTFDRKIVVEQEGDALPELYGNSGQLKQLMLNLCVNARDALESLPGSGTAPRIVIGAEVTEIDAQDQGRHGGLGPGEYVRLYVADNGPGMTPAIQKRVFEPFFTTKGVDAGTGLGLATAYGIVDQHDGWIGVESHPGEGTTFEVLLPLAFERRATPREEGTDPPTLGGSERLLVVDDDDRVRQVVGSALRKIGYTISWRPTASRDWRYSAAIGRFSMRSCSMFRCRGCPATRCSGRWLPSTPASRH